MAEKGKKQTKPKAKSVAKPKAKVSKSKTKTDRSDTLTREEKIALATARNKKSLLAALAEFGGNVTKACEKTGLSRQTHYDYMSDPEYASAVNDVYEVGCDEAEQTIVELMRTSEVDKVRLDAAKEILKARGKKRGYGTERREQEHSGSIQTEPIVIQLPDNGRRSYTDD